MTARGVGLLGTGLLIVAGAVGILILSSFGQSSRHTETGLVVGVDSSGLTDVRGFTIRTNDGRTLVFRIGVLENGAQFPPGHLLEHEGTGVRVLVTYHEENGELVAIRMDDAPGAATAGPSPTAASS